MSSAPQIPGYQVAGPLGAGSTATVFRARRLADGLAVAVKVIRTADGQVQEALHEAGLLARVRHPHVLHLYDVLPLPVGEGEPPTVALVTRLAAGGSLAQVLARRQLLSPGELVTVLQPIAGALADLHQAGVVHGDLSTGNILFREDGMPLLADLGTARIAGEHRLRGVGTGAGDGMVAPEVVEGFPATRESDVYQLGALARLCLVGEVPGPGYDRPVLAEVAPALPELLVDLVDRCMAAQPEDRPDAEELAVALSTLIPPEPVEVAPDADAAHGLTQRLRQVAQEDEKARALRELPGAHRPERVGSDDSGDRAGRSPLDPGVRRRALIGLGVGLLVLVLMIGAGWSVARSWFGPGGQDVATVDGAGSPGERAGQDGQDTADEAASAPGEAASAPPTRGTATPQASGTLETLQRLVDARARAWQAGDEELLQDALAPGSPASAQEVRELGRAQEQGVSYPAVRFAVQEAVVVEEDQDRMVVAAAVRREPLEAVGPQGWLLRAPARTDRVQVELVLVGERWLLWSWRDGEEVVEEPGA